MRGTYRIVFGEKTIVIFISLSPDISPEKSAHLDVNEFLDVSAKIVGRDYNVRSPTITSIILLYSLAIIRVHFIKTRRPRIENVN